ncbi:hypothetical protein EZV62_027868 [Acer yangbiense]|uniref:Uncharacterized protein n=1 Tax=Acer yangbiense TaxID=1000413 RepID=A0A5C7GQ23_9ROSI|nr:hypothetical protein EZV62_027868 [Acer yangbiense]
MFRSRVIGSILKRNKAQLNNISSNLKEISSRRIRLHFLGIPIFALGNHKPSVRNMSMAASVGMENKEGFKLLVLGGPNAQKMVRIWLFGSAAWVFSMVVLGGVTRLIRSGLSMTDWKFTGGLPPLSDEGWFQEFEKYKQSPEMNINGKYKLHCSVNKGMSIEDFKFIYWMEYAHRMWGRGIGIIFALPFSYFLRKGYITLRLGLRLFSFRTWCWPGFYWLVDGEKWFRGKKFSTISSSFFLFCGVFWLLEPPSEYAQPRVSPYRLAAHLTSAFVIYSGLFWTGLSVVMPEPPAESVTWVCGAAKVKKLALPVGFIVGITAISGAFVAGNGAGRAYNTFPKMGDTWILDDIFDMKPLIRNFFENTSTVQHSWHGRSLGDLRDFHTSLICASFTWLGTSGWGSNSSDSHDLA